MKIKFKKTKKKMFWNILCKEQLTVKYLFRIYTKAINERAVIFQYKLKNDTKLSNTVYLE